MTKIMETGNFIFKWPCLFNIPTVDIWIKKNGRKIRNKIIRSNIIDITNRSNLDIYLKPESTGHLFRLGIGLLNSVHPWPCHRGSKPGACSHLTFRLLSWDKMVYMPNVNQLLILRDHLLLFSVSKCCTPDMVEHQ